MKEIEVKNFELTYDGMYFIIWRNHRFRVFLQLNTILKMLEIEGLSYNEVNEKILSMEPIKFSKVTMTITGEEDNDGRLNLLISNWTGEYFELEDITMFDLDLKASE